MEHTVSTPRRRCATATLPEPVQHTLQARLQEEGQAVVAEKIGVHAITLTKAAAGLGVQRAMAAYITARVRELFSNPATVAA